jgi:hypothetical protein
MSEITFVTGLWDLNRENMDNTNNNFDWKRSFKMYTDNLEKLLSTELSIVVYGDDNIKEIVEKYTNAKYIYYPIEKFNESPYYDRIQNIRTSPEWYNQPNAEWLKSSPQAKLPLYVLIQYSKMYFIENTASINPFNSGRFYWLDAGITKNHDVNLLRNMIPSLMKYTNFTVFSHYYVDNTEIHGFLREAVHRYCNVSFVDRIMKGFFWGGTSKNLNEIVELYNNIIDKSLNEKLLGLDETILTIISYKRPDLFDKVIIHNCENVMQFL